MWRNLRIGILLLILLWAAGHTWLERIGSTGWRQPLWVGIFPVNADDSPVAQRYIDSLDADQFADIAAFMAGEAHRYGRSLPEPVHLELYPQIQHRPPQLSPGAGLAGTASWSLQMRWFAWRHASTGGRPPARIRLFVLYHDPTSLQSVPDSHGLQKGLLGVVHAFALKPMAGSNNIVITHELLHTLGATDKYDPQNGLPLFPLGCGDPDRQPLYPQDKAAIMAGRVALSAQEAQMPASLRSVLVGPVTAAEIRWVH